MYNLQITPLAQKRIQEVNDYLLTEWGYKTRRAFIQKLNHCLEIIKKNPYSFPTAYDCPELRRCVVTPLNILYYTIQESNIIIVSIEDTRMQQQFYR